MGCTSGISKTITSNCTTAGTGGIEVKAWIGNRARFTPTYSPTAGKENVVTALTPTAGTDVLYPILGVKKLLNCGHDRVVQDARPDLYKHFFSFQGFELTQAALMNFDAMADIFVVVELKDKQTGGDGTFEIFGLTHGLYASTDTRRANDLNGARNMEFTSMDGQEEIYSSHVFLDTNYATSLAALVALET